MRHLVFPPLSPHPTYPQLKICGMRAPQNIQDVAATQPTLMGFIFTSHSPRYVDTAETAEIVRILPPNIRKIGVFVNQATPTMLKTAQTFRLDGLQLHGDEPPEQLHEIRQQEPHLVLIKAFGIHPTFTFPTLHAYAPLCDLFLFDTHSKDYGGTGRTFDWNLLQNVTTQVPFLLAGGLDATQLQHIRAHLDKA
ncbi:MAG: phosphoribosylanthranilate isomerase, partial [Myxococcota bacterium]